MSHCQFSQHERWETCALPGAPVTEGVFRQFLHNHKSKRAVIYPAVPLGRAKSLTDFQLPPGITFDSCLKASLRPRDFRDSLAGWHYQSQLQPAAQLPQFKPLPAEHASLDRSPWCQLPAPSRRLGINARLLRNHCQLWHDLKPRTLRGVQTTLVLVSPQIGLTLTPHVSMEQLFMYMAALSRVAGPAQMFPARYLYPDASLAGLEDTPAAIFADLLPTVGGWNTPMRELTPDIWGTLARYDVTDRYYGYPFTKMLNPLEDMTLTGWHPGSMIRPDGRVVHARQSESRAFATLDPSLRHELKLPHEQFVVEQGTKRSTVTHDGLPFQLPVEMQGLVHSIHLTAWELELDQPGKLTGYTLKTRHAAIRGFNFYQRVEPYYHNFLRLIHELAKDPDFVVYPLSNHLTHTWLGGNLRLANQWTDKEREHTPEVVRSFCHQQLDWLLGVHNLWAHIPFRQRANLEAALPPAGVVFHQMRPRNQMEAHLFQRPQMSASPWPNQHLDWQRVDEGQPIHNLPRI